MEFTGSHTGETMTVNTREVRAFRETKRDDSTKTIIDWGHGRSLQVREGFDEVFEALRAEMGDASWDWALFEDARHAGMRLAVNPLAYQSARAVDSNKATAIDLGSGHEVFAATNFADTIDTLNTATMARQKEEVSA